MTPSLQTARLLLEPLRLEDAPQIQAEFPQWEIVRLLASVVPWPYPDDGAQRWCEEELAAVERGDEWCWTLRPKSSPDRIIGVIHLMKKNEHRGFWLAPSWQRQGFMTEAVEVVTDFWFNVLNFDVLRVTKAVPKHSFTPHFGKDRDAARRHNRKTLCVRSVRRRNMGDYR
jgi:RimJ/RimL family protein N-acetyltransferase